MAQQSDIPYEIFTIDGLYKTEQLDEWSSRIGDCNGDKPFTDRGFKNGKIVLPAVSGLMWGAIRPHLPDVYTDRNGRRWCFRRASRYVMYAKVSEGQSFPLHTDTGSELSSTEESRFTVLTYLNDGFGGGNTVFYDDNFIKTVEVMPKKGRTLVFDIELFHEGQPVLCGEKLWIGTELVCSPL